MQKYANKELQDLYANSETLSNLQLTEQKALYLCENSNGTFLLMKDGESWTKHANVKKLCCEYSGDFMGYQFAGYFYKNAWALLCDIRKVW